MSAASPDSLADSERLVGRAAVFVFLAFAMGYFSSAVVRAVIATLSPVLTQEFGLTAADLGLLGGGFFLGFASTQLLLGAWLDKYGPGRVAVCFLAVAVLGCLAFPLSNNFAALLASRVLLGVGVSACLMAPLTGFRRWYEPAQMLRANSWMLMVGSLGMVCATLPVQWLLPLVGWRPLFWGMAGLLLVAMVLTVRLVPGPSTAPPDSTQPAPGYAAVWRSPAFRRLLPVSFFINGGLIALQTLWLGPWLTRVVGLDPLQAAAGLFSINLASLVAFSVWGLVMPTLSRRGWTAERLLRLGIPLMLCVLTVNLALGSHAGWPAWAVFVALASVVSLAQPALSMTFAPSLAGRALSAYNLVCFLGIFFLQWGIGLAIDGLLALGCTQATSFQGAFAIYLCSALASYIHYVRAKADNLRP
ncbi:MAG: MFS transporter [Comamonadaceae bacterium]|jgi:predicted MFS family arabinose efflux permease|nr:MFS transporter [Comamonadaceae bacterium]